MCARLVHTTREYWSKSKQKKTRNDEETFAEHMQTHGEIKQVVKQANKTKKNIIVILLTQATIKTWI